MHVAVFVGKDLDLDMTRTFDVTFDVNRSVLERRQGFGLRRLKLSFPVPLPCERSAFRARRRRQPL